MSRRRWESRMLDGDGDAVVGILWGMALSAVLFWVPVGVVVWKVIHR